MLKRWFDQRHLLWLIVVVSFGYAAAITVLNLNHIRTMPEETRVMLPSLQSLMAALEPVRIIESPATMPETDETLERRDVHVEYGRQVFPASRSVWINTAASSANPERYLRRFRAGYLRHDADGVALEALFLIEVHQNFRRQGDEPTANLWMFPLQQQSNGAGITDAVLEARFAHNVALSEARADPHWRAVFADSHARLVRAFPALAAVIAGLAALGSLLFKLWREQPWAVAATTVMFMLPLVSAAPFLTAFGWTPVMAAVILGFVLTTAIVCAIDQRLLPLARARFTALTARRLIEAFLVPGSAMMVGTALVVSFASVSVIPWQGLGSAAPADIFMQSLVIPAVGLLLGGTGTCLILALFHLLLNWRNVRAGRPESFED